MEKTNKEIITEIIEDLENTVGLNWLNKNAKVTREKLIECWSEYRLGSDYSFYDYKVQSSLSRAQLNIFKNINKSKTTEQLKNYILRMYNYKYCPQCKVLQKLSNFHVDNEEASNHKTQCKLCWKTYKEIYRKTDKAKNLDKHSVARRKLAKLQRMPAWANIEKIKEIYINCPKGYHVDHIIPLRGKLVSGFHIENNLQYLKAEDNLSKSNKFSLEDNLEYLPYFPANKFEV